MSDAALMPWTSPLSLETDFPRGVRGPVLLRALARLAASRAGLISRFGFAPVSDSGPAWSCCSAMVASHSLRWVHRSDAGRPRHRRRVAAQFPHGALS